MRFFINLKIKDGGIFYAQSENREILFILNKIIRSEAQRVIKFYQFNKEPFIF